MSQTIDLTPFPYDNTKSQQIEGFWRDYFANLDENHGEVFQKQNILYQQHKDFIKTLCVNSPYLLGIIKRHPNWLFEFLEERSVKKLDTILETIKVEALKQLNLQDASAYLRLQKSRIALLLAMGDVEKSYKLGTITSGLSRFADLCLDILLCFIVHNRMRRGDLEWPKGEEQPPCVDLVRNCGLTILALGKLGGFELNYSSDIDLIVLYDSQRVPDTGKRMLGDLCVRITRDLVRAMEDHSAFGYIFRTDLRLRPDPGSTPLALSVIAAENYYQTIGQTWERSAFIKARPCAGDLKVGFQFLEFMIPFIWRKNMDFTALEDIQNMKNMIHEHHHHEEYKLAGYDVKLGHGGIREIEFFAQMHQLILGGRDYNLRTIATLDTLSILKSNAIITAETHRNLRQAYHFLRTLEHRIQMINDEQSHKVPEDTDHIKRLSAFMGFKTVADFDDTLNGTIKTVHEIYQSMLTEKGMNSDQDDDKNISLDRLKELGYESPDIAFETIKRWQSGRYKALRTERARRFLGQSLVPLIGALAKADEPDKSLSRFDNFIANLPQGVQIFALFHANQWLFDVISRIMSLSPRLADHLARKPHLFDAVLDPGFFTALPDKAALKHNLELTLKRCSSYEDVLDTCRRWVHNHQFNIGVQLIEGIISVTEANLKFTEIADITLECLLPRVTNNYQDRYGAFESGELAVIAMGSYGGKSLTFTSDLDLIMLYDAPEEGLSEKGHSASQYYSRLGQHIITALTALTAEGQLYDVDMRLRPSGRKGPLVVTLETFDSYQHQDAWAFEHMALTRARIVSASAPFAGRIPDSITSVLTLPRDKKRFPRPILDLREKVDLEYGSSDVWAVKYVRGGLVDAEFIIQYLLLKHGDKRTPPFVIGHEKALQELIQLGVLSEQDGNKLNKAAKLLSYVMNILRLCYETKSKDRNYSNELIKLLCKTTSTKDKNDLVKQLEQAQEFVYALFQHTINE